MASADQSASFFQDFDIHLLNEQERQELLNFYQSLINRHKSKKLPQKKIIIEKDKAEKKSVLFSFTVKPFEPLKREQIYVR